MEGTGEHVMSATAVAVCLYEHAEGHITNPVGTVDLPLIVDVRSQPTDPFDLMPIDSLALATSALANVSAIATSATELTAAEKNQLRAIFAARIRSLMTQV